MSARRRANKSGFSELVDGVLSLRARDGVSRAGSDELPFFIAIACNDELIARHL